MSVADSAMTREVFRYISKRPIDLSDLEVHVSQGVVYLHGKIGLIRGYYDDVDLEEELHTILKILRQRPGIRDVCCEVVFVRAGVQDSQSPRRKRL